MLDRLKLGTIVTSIFCLVGLGIESVMARSIQAVDFGPVEYKGDYFFHPDGTKVRFYRRSDVYSVLLAQQPSTKTKKLSLAEGLRQNFGQKVEIVGFDHYSQRQIIKINKGQAKARSVRPIDAWAIKSSHSSVLEVQPYLVNEKGEQGAVVTGKVILQLSDAYASKETILAVARRFNLRLLRRLKAPGAMYQLESLNSANADVGQRFSIVRQIALDDRVAWAQPVFKSRPKKRSFRPDDPLFDRQWHLSNTGLRGARCDADCDADAAWGIGVAAGTEGAASLSGAGMVIAVIDDGVQLDHEDLRIWVNPGEIGGGKESNGVDDDGNGCIDDVNGCDFVDDSLSALLNPLADLTFCTQALIAGGDPVDSFGVKCRCQDNDGNLGPDGNPGPQNTSTCLDFNDQVTVEQDDHGTAVAGLAAARGDNGLGVVGTAYAAEILPIRLVSDFDGDPQDDFCARAAEAFAYAGRYADVINNSWSMQAGTCPALDTVIELVVDGLLTQNSVDSSNELTQQSIVNISKRPNLGSPVVFSAGNDASGWVKVTVPVSAGEHTYEWRFLRRLDVGGAIPIELSLDDKAWLDDINFPDGSVEQFESGIPRGEDGFELGCEINKCNSDCNGFSFLPGEECISWEVNTDPDFSRSGNSAMIDHSANTSPCNYNYLRVVKNGPAGDISFWIWVSTDLQQFADKVEFLIDGKESISFGDAAKFVDNGVSYPASLNKVIAVGASNSGDLTGVSSESLLAQDRASYSQYGAELDVLAPGNDQHLGVVTTDRYGLSAGYNHSTAIGNEVSPGRYTQDFGGTSASAPIVSGIAAALLASNTGLTASDVEQTLRATADKIGRRGASAYLPDGAGGLRSDFYGYGRVNMFAALQSALGLADSIPVQNCSPDTFDYSVAIDLLLPSFTPRSTEFCPAVNFSLDSTDEICFPIPAQNGGFAIVCL